MIFGVFFMFKAYLRTVSYDVTNEAPVYVV